MNMLRHKKNCKNNIDNHFDYKDRKNQEDLILQKKLLIKEFKNLNLKEMRKEIKSMSNPKIKSMLMEFVSNEQRSSKNSKNPTADTHVNLQGNPLLL
jgi:hypothetical protein